MDKFNPGCCEGPVKGTQLCLWLQGGLLGGGSARLRPELNKNQPGEGRGKSLQTEVAQRGESEGEQ